MAVAAATSLLFAFSAKVPFFPVPMTLRTFAVIGLGFVIPQQD
jgi:biotin transporter BioY